MFGFFGFPTLRLVTALVALAALLVGAALAGFYFWAPHATLRVTTGPAGGMADRFVSAMIATASARHPRIHFETVSVPNLVESSKALEQGKVDIAIVRSDVAPPLNGETLVILRRDALALILPPGSAVKNVAQLAGKTIAIPANWAQEDNSRALDMILAYYGVAPESVKRLFLPIAEIGAAIHDKRAAASFTIGPIGPGPAVDTVAAVAKATHGAPEILALDDNEAINRRFPGLESIDIPEGAFKARPATPSDEIKGLAVTYRLAAPVTMIDVVAGVIGRAILKGKNRLVAATPLAMGIEAPDPDEKNPVLPIHPGVASYLSSGDQSFFDESQKYLYAIGIPLSLFGSLAAIVTGLMRGRRLQEDQNQIFRLLVIAEEAATATRDELELLEREFKSIFTTTLRKLVEGSSGADQASVSMAVEHARRAIAERKSELRAQ